MHACTEGRKAQRICAVLPSEGTHLVCILAIRQQPKSERIHGPRPASSLMAVLSCQRMVPDLAEQQKRA